MNTAGSGYVRVRWESYICEYSREGCMCGQFSIGSRCIYRIKSFNMYVYICCVGGTTVAPTALSEVYEYLCEAHSFKLFKFLFLNNKFTQQSNTYSTDEKIIY